MPTNYLAGMVQPHEIMGQFGNVQTPFELQAQGMQVQSAKNKLLADETQRNALAEYAQTGEIESLRASPDLYFKAMQRQAPKYSVTSVGVGEGQMQRAMINQRDPFGQPILYGSPYYAPGTYQEGMSIPPAAGMPTAGIPGQQLPPAIPAPPLAAQPTIQPTIPAQPTIQKVDGAVASGIPIVPKPTYPGLSRKDAASRTMRTMDKAEDMLADMQGRKAENQIFMNSADRFLNLNEKTETGGITGSTLIGGVRKAFGDEDLQEMSSIESQIVPKMRAPGSGTTSDFDATMFKDATFGIGKKKDTNRNIVMGFKVGKILENEKTDFLQEFYDTNGHLKGSEAKWKEYLNENPIFDPSAKKGSYELNSNRQTYKQHFSGAWTPKVVNISGKKVRITDPKKYQAYLKDTGQK